MTTTNPVGLGGFFSLFDLPPTIYKNETLERLGTAMSEAWSSAHTRIPSGYVYLGQMLAHDLTKLQKPGEQITPVADELVQLRTPMLDLDCVYGMGFDDLTLAVNRSTGEMLLGRVVNDSGSGAEDDLPRDSRMRALIPDDRNDENLLLAQMHVLFLKLHNFFVRKIRRGKPGVYAATAIRGGARQVIVHYQQVVLYDLLDAVCDPQVWEYVIGYNRGTLWDPVPQKRLACRLNFPQQRSGSGTRWCD